MQSIEGQFDSSVTRP
nr:unnamed protein product [Callosobruchus chinensis]